jgi:hypothetical protein
MSHMIPEYLVVELPQDEDEPQHRELEIGDGPAVDINDPRLTQEVQWLEPAADAYATHVALKIMIEASGEPSSVAVRWN